MTLKELQEKADAAKKLADTLARIESIRDAAPSLRRSDGQYVDTDISLQAISLGLAALEEQVKAKLEELLKS